MTELSEAARTLLREAGEQYAPSEHELTQLTAALSAKLGVPLDATTLAPIGEPASLGRLARPSLQLGKLALLKAVGTTVVVAAVAAASWATYGPSAPSVRSREPLPPHRVQSPARLPSAAPTAEATPLAASPAPGPEPKLPRPDEQHVERPHRTAPVDRRSSARTTSSIAPAPAAQAPAAPAAEESVAVHEGKRGVSRSPPEDQLASEIAIIGAARTLLTRGEPQAAMRELDRHEASFEAGALQEERLLLRVLVLCALGQPASARATARRLKQLAPGSTHLLRLSTSCVGSD